MGAISWVPLSLYSSHLFPPLPPYLSLSPSLSNPQTPTYAPTYSSSISLAYLTHIYIRPYIYQTGRQPFGLFPLYLFYSEGAFDSWKSECSGRICWRMTRWSNDPIALILSYHEDKTYTRGHTGKHTTVEDLHQRSQEIDGIWASLFPLYLILCLSLLFCVLALYQSLLIVFIFCFCFLSVMFPYLLAAGLRLYNLHFPLFFFCLCVFVFCCLLNITMCTYILERRTSRCFNLE